MSKLATPPVNQASIAVTANEARPAQPLFNFPNARFVYEPYPVGIVTPLIEDSLYKKLVDSYPDVSLFKLMPYLGNKQSVKYSLAEMNNPKEYKEFLAATPAWREFYEWVKTPDFIVRTLKMLSKKNIELGYIKPDGAKKSKSLIEQITQVLQGKKDTNEIPLSARFEFSILPADGGQLHPHTDSPGKIITWVISMLHPGEWNSAFGGGTEIMRPKKTELNFNWVNRYLEFDDVETLSTYDFLPNQGLVFVKTFNSWHGVRPMSGQGSNMLRRTLTINIESGDETY